MIDGVTILATELTGSKDILLFATIMFGLSALLILVLAIKKFMEERSPGPAIMLLFLGLLEGVIFAILVNSYNIWNPDEHKQYIVTIDDSVGFKEFYNNYKVLGVNGDLYTIEIREK